MKKIYLLIIGLLLSFLMILLVFWQNRQPTHFRITDQADTYLVTNQRIYSLQQENGKMELIDKEDLPIAEYVHYGFPRANLDNRYLVFSKGWDYPHAYPIATVSLDFQTGKISSQPTQYFATFGAGQSQNFYYTWEASDQARLTQFDKEGQEIQSVTYPGILLASSSFISDTDGLLQLEATRDNQDGQYQSQLLTIREEDLTLLSEEAIYPVPNQHYRFGNSLVQQGVLYAPVHSIRDLTSMAASLSNQILVKNLTSQEVTFLDLPELAPLRLHAQGDYFLIEHDASSIGKVGFSLVNRQSGQTAFINLTQILGQDLTSTDTNLKHFSLDSEGKLLFVLGKDLIYFDLEKQQVLDKLQLREEEEEEVIALWDNHP